MKPQVLARLTWIELKLFVREPVAMLFTLAFPLVVMIVIAGVFNVGPGGPGNPFRGVGGAEYYVVSNIGVVIAAIGLIALPTHLAAYAERGIIRRFRASGVSLAGIVLAQALVSFIVGVAATAVLLVAAAPIYTYHQPKSLLGAMIGFSVGMIAFLAVALLIAALSPGSRGAQGIGLILFFPLWLISGAGPPLAVLPSTMRRAADANPLGFAGKALQDPWFGFGITGSNLVVLIAIAVVCGAASAAVYRRRLG